MSRIVERFQAVWMGVAVCLLVLLGGPVNARAQSLTTGAIAGTVKDPSGAVVPNATVTATNLDTGAVRTTMTNANGGYSLPQLNPAKYKVNVKAKGFRTQEQSSITVSVSQTVDLDFNLELGTATEVVEVTEQAPLLQTTNPNTTSTLDTHEIESIPNPGMDLSYEANFAPGAVMNTTGGFGNVEYNGLPATSNNFTIDGLDANDPFLNLNNSGATNLQLGLSSMQEVTINTTSYSVDQGRLGAAQINYLTKSGSNDFHGNVWEIWNGSRWNAADFFVNSHQFGPADQRPHKPRSNVNQFGAAGGGPLIHDKLFFWADFEEIRIILPLLQDTLKPTANYQSYTLGQLATGGCDYVFDPSGCAAGSSFFQIPAQPAEVPFYTNMFSLYGNTSAGVPTPMFGCPVNPDGTLLPVPSPATPTANTPDGAGCGNHRLLSQSTLTDDAFFNLKVDHNLNNANTVWYKFSREHGLQATYTDPINPLFSAVSDQPQYTGTIGWTHTFSPTMVNQFTPGVSWYSAIFQPRNPTKTAQTFPEAWEFGPFTGVGNALYVWPQGRNVTQWQLIDNLTWTRGKHEFRFGENLRRLLVSDHDFGFFNTPLVIPCSLPEVTYGITCFTIQSFPKLLAERVGIVNLDGYAQDTMRLTPKLTLTAGLRATNNSNPIAYQKLIARFAGSWYDTNHNVDTPLNQDIKTGLSHLYPSSQAIIWQPRGAVSFEVNPKTVIRAGVGVFSDLFPASIADSMATNPPYDNTFSEGIFGLGNGTAIAPAVSGSAIDAAATDNQTFLGGFFGGVLSCASASAPPNCLPQLNITNVERRVKNPYFIQWSLGVQHEFTTNWFLNVQYVGTRGVQIPYTVAPNGFQTVCTGCYRPWPDAPADARFFGATQFISGANSNYHGLQVTGRKRLSRGLQFDGNYTWSHCLDTISNGGFFGYGNPGSQLNAIPGNLKRNYGPCDYDYRHTFNGFYTFQLPFKANNRILGRVIGGWELSGSLIYHTGTPLSIGTGLQGGALNSTSGPVYPNLVPGQALYQHTAITPAGTDCTVDASNCITQPGNLQWLNPNAFLAVVDPDTQLCVPASSNIAASIAAETIDAATCQFGNLQRNFLRGPKFSWSDFFLTKRFKLTERMTFGVAAQFYNVFNHPNFAAPGGGAGIPGHNDTLIGFGNIGSTARPPTGLLGSFLGGDTAPRMIGLKGTIQF